MRCRMEIDWQCSRSGRLCKFVIWIDERDRETVVRFGVEGTLLARLFVKPAYFQDRLNEIEQVLREGAHFDAAARRKAAPQIFWELDR